MTAESEEERRVWRLLTLDFRWEVPTDYPVQVYASEDIAERATRLQVFEISVAAVFARLRPDYDWYVTPNRPDGGIDFVGEQRFLQDEALGIAAAITVGGQCKKRSTVHDIVGEVSGSLLRMAKSLNPTFFVVALSARLRRDRVEAARQILEHSLNRHCHILDRRQIEGLLHDHISVIDPILRAALSEDERIEVLDYLDSYESTRPSSAVDVIAPERVLAGVPFTVTLHVRGAIATAQASRLWWSQESAVDAEVGLLTLISPIGADGPSGAPLASQDPGDRVIEARVSLELVTYAVGEVGLGVVLLGLEQRGISDPVDRILLGNIHVIENLRPRFFTPPFRSGLDRLEREFERSLAGGIASIGVVGAGGSGKSRLCEEFSLEKRRRGGGVVAASQAKTLDDPNRVLADLFVGLTAEDLSPVDPSDGVITAIERYDHPLAERAAPAIRSIFGSNQRRWGTIDEQSILSSLMVLIVARGRRAPVVVHLQDLHWCTADVLMLLERLVWQLGLVLSGPSAVRRSPRSGVLFVFEGRVQEQQRLGDDGWASEPFEAFLQKLDCTIVSCLSFAPDDGLEFIARLFEERYSACRRGSSDLLELQRDLVGRIDRAAGGNPFHSLEQVRMLKELHVLGQNPGTGLLYLIQPESSLLLLPDSVFEAIQLRWHYLKSRAPELALLVWAAALLEDRIPTPLFRRLWREIAPDVSLGDVDATDLLWTGGGVQRDIAFRHENYFNAIRRFEVSAKERNRVVDTYVGWFEATTTGDPTDRFRWARVLLERTEPDVVQAQALMRSALTTARRRGDQRLARRIAAASLDLTWTGDVRSPIRMNAFIRSSDEDLALARDLLGSDRAQAARRLDGVRDRLAQRASDADDRSSPSFVELQRCRLTAEVLRSQVLFNDRRPSMAAAVAAQAIRDVQALRQSATRNLAAWEALEMESLYAHGVALALSGELDESLDVCEQAVGLAQTSASPLRYKVIHTYANILLVKDPDRSEVILRECLALLNASPGPTGARDEAEINLSMALVLRAHRAEPASIERCSALAEAERLLTRVFTEAFQVGRYPDAGAASLMLGIVSALRSDNDEVSWFAQAVASAARGRQIETLWRSHINLATALFRSGQDIKGGVRDHARASLEIIEETLLPYPQPDRSARFRLVRVPLAQAVRYLLLADDPEGTAALERHPGLRSSFADVRPPTLAEPCDPRTRYYEWLRIGNLYYVLY